ncbi:hypothetical protein [Microcoleus sp. S13_C3]
MTLFPLMNQRIQLRPALVAALIRVLDRATVTAQRLAVYKERS